MPFELLAASATRTILDGVTNAGRALTVYTAPQNAGSGIDLEWLDPAGPTQMKRIQQNANATGDPWAVGFWGWHVPAGCRFDITNRSAGAAVYILWTVVYLVPVPVPPA